MRWIAAFFFFLPVFSLTDTENSANGFHICFFELNNQTTSANLKKDAEFKKSLNAGTKVHLFTPGNSYKASKGFKAMIEDIQNDPNKRCDSLVISGHHTGNWGGEFGSLKLKELEDLSCDPKYKGWFKNIKALWLDGCNTVTDNLVKSSETISPDGESARVSEKERKERGETYIEESLIRDLNQAYTLSLDQNTPLSSRYLRAFPNTEIYGFNGPAPLGDPKKNQVGSESFIANHLSELGSALKADTKLPEEQSNMDNITLGITALFSDVCDTERFKIWGSIGEKQGLTAEAIEKQNYEMAQKLGCDLILAKQILDDPDSIEAQTALANKVKEGGYPAELLNLANEILNSTDESSKKAVKLAKKLVNQTLDTIIKKDEELRKSREDPTLNHLLSNNIGLKKGFPDLSLSHLLFNNIYETWTTAKKYKTKDNGFFKSVKRKLQSNNFKTSLKNRIESPRTSSIRKADYIKFYMDVNNVKMDDIHRNAVDESLQFIPTNITDLVDKSTKLFPDIQSERGGISKKSRRALALSTADQLLQYDLLIPAQKDLLLNNKDLFPENTEDPFNISVKMRFKVDTKGPDAILKQLSNKEFKIIEKAPVMRALSRYYFNQEDRDFSELIEPLDNLTNLIKDTRDERLRDTFWEELKSYLHKKPRGEAKKLIEKYPPKKSYLRGFLKHYEKIYLKDN